MAIPAISEKDHMEPSENFSTKLKKIDLSLNQFKIVGDGKTTLSAKVDKVTTKEGPFFIKLPEAVSNILPGSKMLPEEFLQQFSSQEGKVDENSNKLLSTENFHQPLKIEDGGEGSDHTFNLNVFNGSFNKHALEVSKLAVQKKEDSKIRAKYQKEVFDEVKPVITYKSNYDYYVLEDCLASADSVAGLFSLLATKSNNKIPLQGAKIRIDVAVATTQGTSLLLKLAKDNGLKIELNVGHLAYGLTSGQEINDNGGNKGKKLKEHANYITYPEEIFNKLPDDEKKKFEQLGVFQVVGDMGEYFKSLPNEYDDKKDYPWNKFRHDPHGDRNYNKDTVAVKEAYNPFIHKTTFFLKNGGLAMEAFRNAIQEEWLKNNQGNILPEENVISITFSRASLLDAGSYDYGIMVGPDVIESGILDDNY